MAILQRLNMDSSWHFSWDESSFIIDPWLLGSEIDGFRWLNEQWHTTPPVPIQEIPDYDFLLISQSYEDHCHINTLKKLSEDKPLLATQKAFKKLRKNFPDRDIKFIPTLHEAPPLNIGDLFFWAIAPPHRRDPVYYATIIFNQHNEAVFYCPHGFVLKKEDIIKINDLSFKLLISTFIEFKLPKWMGGKVNPGLENVKELIAQVNPEKVINTHDENKKMKGLVARLAKIKTPNRVNLGNIFYQNFPNYHPQDVF